MLATRVITGLALGAAVTATILFLSTSAAAVVMGSLWLAGGWEWAGFAGAGRRGRSVYVLVAASCLFAAYRFGLAGSVVEAVLAVALAAWSAALCGVLTYPRRLARPIVLSFGLAALVPAWFLLMYIHRFADRGPELALTGLALVWAADVGAYFTGRSLGRVKLAPKVSPAKTWEGVVGGAVLAMLAGWLASLALDLKWQLLVPVAAATALASVVGDLAVSMLKRNAGLKDSGRLLPGHGGVMDRIDGLLAAVPIYTIGLQFAGLLP